jgi:hypothetical protein
MHFSFLSPSFSSLVPRFLYHTMNRHAR